MLRFITSLLFTITVLGLTGCATYKVPGAKADLQAFAPASIQESFASKPTHPFPASLAVVRVQAPDYRNHNLDQHGGRYGDGRYSVIFAKEVETEAHLSRLKSLPQVQGVTSLNRMLLPEKLETDRELREAAARLHADLLFVYTFDTAFFDRNAAKPLSVVSLGLSPTRHITATTTASALLIDTRTGHIYATLETNERAATLSTSWGSADAADAVRLKTEARAFDKLIDEFTKAWPGLLPRPQPVPSNRPLTRFGMNTER